MDSDEISEDCAAPEDYDPDVVSLSDDDEEMFLSEDEEGNVVSKKPVAKRGITATRSRTQESLSASKRGNLAAKRASQKPVTKRTRAKLEAVPNLIRKHDLGVFEDSSEDELDGSTSHFNYTAVDFRHLSLKQDHFHRHVPLHNCSPMQCK
jgi:hypothetical protein